MKLFLRAAALLLLSSTASYADTPEILNSLPKDSVQVMTKNDTIKTRGEYRVKSVYANGVYIPEKRFDYFKGYTYYEGSGNNMLQYTYLRQEIVGSLWWKKKVYVAR